MKKEKGDALDIFVDKLQKQIRAEERTIYSKKILEEYDNPKNVGRMRNPDGVGIITGPCGDTMEIFLKVNEGEITQASFMTDGCGATIACGSMITGMVKGKRIGDAKKIAQDTLIEALSGLPEEKLHCAELTITSLQEAIKKYKNKGFNERNKK